MCKLCVHPAYDYYDSINFQIKQKVGEIILAKIWAFDAARGISRQSNLWYLFYRWSSTRVVPVVKILL